MCPPPVHRKRRREYRLSQQASFQDSLDSDTTATPMTLSRDSRSFDGGYYHGDSLLSPPVPPGLSPRPAPLSRQQQRRPPLVRTECVLCDSERGTLEASTSRSDEEMSSGADDVSTDVDAGRKRNDERCKRTPIQQSTSGSSDVAVPEALQRRRCPNGLLTPLPNGDVVVCTDEHGLFSRPKAPTDARNLTPCSLSTTKTLPLKDNRVKTTALSSRRCVTLGPLQKQNQLVTSADDVMSGEDVDVQRLSKEAVVELWRSTERRLAGQLRRALREKEKLEQKLAMLLPETAT